MAKSKIGELMSIGVDIGKDTFQIVGFDPDGQLVMRKQIKRLALVATFEKLPNCIVGIKTHQMKDVLADVDANHQQVRKLFGPMFAHHCFSFFCG